MAAGGLKAEADVAQLSLDDRRRRKKRSRSSARIDRASRLVDQLLTLSRLDSLENLDDVEPIKMADLLQSAVLTSGIRRSRRVSTLRSEHQRPQAERTGQPLLLSLVRNLLITPFVTARAVAWADVTLDAHCFSVRDNGLWIALEALACIGERFIVHPARMPRAAGWDYRL